MIKTSIKKLVFTVLLSLFTFSLFGQGVAVRREELTNETATIKATLARTVTRADTNSLADGFWSANRMPLPPRVWGTWNDFTTETTSTTNVHEQYVMRQCDWYATNGMRDAGFKYIIVEEGWNMGLDGSGNFIIHSNFPSGMAALATYIKERGFIPGIYTSLGANGPSTTCVGWAGTCYTNLNQHVQSFTDWGYEFIFFDTCNSYVQWTQAPANTIVALSGDYPALYLERTRLVAAAIQKTGSSPAVLIAKPESGSEFVKHRPDPRAVGLNNIFSTDGAEGWDLIPTTATMFDIATHFRSNWFNSSQYVGQGNYPYGYINHWNIWDGAEGVKLTLSLNAIIPSAYFVATAGNRVTWGSDPTTWYETYLTPYATNLSVAAVHLDSAVIPGRFWASNNLCEVWTRPLGGYNTGTNAVLIVNTDSSAHDVSVPHFYLNVPTATLMSYDDLWIQGSNIVSDVTSNLVINVPAKTTKLMKAYPTPASVWVEHGIVYGTTDGSGVGALSPVTYGPSPFYNTIGMSQTDGSSYCSFLVPVPPGKSKVTTVMQVASAYAGNMAWTNSPKFEWYDATAGRINKDNASDSNITKSWQTSPSGGGVWTTNISRLTTPTNTPMTFIMQMLAASNTSARYIIGPVLLKWE